MTINDRLFSLEQVDMAIRSIYVTNEDTETLKRVFTQLADTLRENERLRGALERIVAMDGNTAKPFINQIASAVAAKALSYKDSEDAKTT